MKVFIAHFGKYTKVLRNRLPSGLIQSITCLAGHQVMLEMTKDELTHFVQSQPVRFVPYTGQLPEKDEWLFSENRPLPYNDLREGMEYASELTAEQAKEFRDNWCHDLAATLAVHSNIYSKKLAERETLQPKTTVQIIKTVGRNNETLEAQNTHATYDPTRF